MKRVVTVNRDKVIADKSIAKKAAVLSLAINQRVALAKKKIEKEVLAQIDEHQKSDARLRLAIVYQAMEDLYLNGAGVTGKAMAIVYLYSSQIKELEEMSIETAWVQRILKEMDILDVTDPTPYIEACLTIKSESRKPSKATAQMLMKYMPICECVEDQCIDTLIDNNHQAA